MDCFGSPTRKSLPGMGETLSQLVSSGLSAAKKQENLGLDRIRILKLIDEVMCEALLQLFTHRRDYRERDRGP